MAKYRSALLLRSFDGGSSWPPGDTGMREGSGEEFSWNFLGIVLEHSPRMLLAVRRDQQARKYWLRVLVLTLVLLRAALISSLGLLLPCSASARTLYAATQGGVTIIDPESGRTLAEVSTSEPVLGLTISPDAKRILLSTAFGISVLDPHAYFITKLVSVPANSTGTLGISLDGNLAIVPGPQDVFLVDLRAGVVLGGYGLSCPPDRVAASAAGEVFYVTTRCNSVVAVNAFTGGHKLVGRLPAGVRGEIAVNTDASLLYVAQSEFGSGFVSVVSPSSPLTTPPAIISTVRFAYHLALSPDQRSMYVVGDELDVVDVDSRASRTRFELGANGPIVTTPEGRFAYIGYRTEAAVAAIDLQTGQRLADLAIREPATDLMLVDRADLGSSEDGCAVTGGPAIQALGLSPVLLILLIFLLLRASRYNRYGILAITLADIVSHEAVAQHSILETGAVLRIDEGNLEVLPLSSGSAQPGEAVGFSSRRTGTSREPPDGYSNGCLSSRVDSILS